MGRKTHKKFTLRKTLRKLTRKNILRGGKSLREYRDELWKIILDFLRFLGFRISSDTKNEIKNHVDFHQSSEVILAESLEIATKNSQAESQAESHDEKLLFERTFKKIHILLKDANLREDMFLTENETKKFLYTFLNIICGKIQHIVSNEISLEFVQDVFSDSGFKKENFNFNDKLNNLIEYLIEGSEYIVKSCKKLALKKIFEMDEYYDLNIAFDNLYNKLIIKISKSEFKNDLHVFFEKNVSSPEKLKSIIEEFAKKYETVFSNNDKVELEEEFKKYTQILSKKIKKLTKECFIEKLYKILKWLKLDIQKEF